MRVPVKALEIAEHVVKNIDGRAADHGISLPFLAGMVAMAPDGDHVDIGSLFGASAIAVALMKKELGHKGTVYCIDPYDEEKRKEQVIPINKEIEEKLSGSPEELMANAEKFDVTLKLIRKESHPWPEELKDNTFVTAYIDGDHLKEAPWNDFVNLRERTTWYIGCDNYEEEYADVVSAMYRAMDDPNWFLYYKNITFIALRRIMPSRSFTEVAPFRVLTL